MKCSLRQDLRISALGQAQGTWDWLWTEPKAPTVTVAVTGKDVSPSSPRVVLLARCALWPWLVTTAHVLCSPCTLSLLRHPCAQSLLFVELCNYKCHISLIKTFNISVFLA